jgi:hypothetical protein
MALALSFSASTVFAQDACGGLDKRGCYEAAQSLISSGQQVTRPDAVAAYDKFNALCRQGHTQSCEVAASLAKDDLKDAKRELDIYAAGCENGRHKYCAAAIAMTQSPSSAVFDGLSAQRYAVMGCAAKDAHLCLLQGELHAPESLLAGTEANGAVAQEGFFLACQHGKGVEHVTETLRAWACSAAFYMDAEYSRYNPNQDYRVKALTTGCAMENLENCSRAIHAFYEGAWGIDRDTEKAGLLAEHACVVGSEDACGEAANIWRETGQMERARKFGTLLCEKYPSGHNCGVLFELLAAEYDYEMHPLVIGEAKTACDKGNARGCLYAASWNTEINGESYQAGQTASLYSKACLLGEQSACQYVQDVDAIAQRRAERNERLRQAAAERERRAEEELNRTQSPSWDDFAKAGQAYWSNWRPSYCKYYTKGNVTSKAECT